MHWTRRRRRIGAQVERVRRVMSGGIQFMYGLAGFGLEETVFHMLGVCARSKSKASRVYRCASRGVTGSPCVCVFVRRRRVRRARESGPSRLRGDGFRSSMVWRQGRKQSIPCHGLGQPGPQISAALNNDAESLNNLAHFATQMPTCLFAKTVAPTVKKTSMSMRGDAMLPYANMILRFRC